jgi:pimeloyl-ACP methyl ester carboxylesterase
MTPERFSIDVPQEVLDDLQDRLARTRWPDAVADDWERGTAPGALATLVDHWRDRFDWRREESRLNQLEHARTEVDGMALHHLRAGTRGRLPLLLLHGWPDSFLRFERLVPLLSDDFDLVVPSIPGFGFSERPSVPGVDPERIADLLAGLMSALGLERFAIHGGDVGSGVGEQLALHHRARVVALHLTDVPYWHLFATDETQLSDAERAYLAQGTAWAQTEGAYAQLQSTKPQTLTYALNDSPAGLAGWFLEKFRAWSDCGDDVIGYFGADTLLANLTLYWVTQTAGSAARVYYDTMAAMRARGGGPEQARVEVPTGVTIFPKDIAPAPREFAERWFDIRHWNQMPRGGHFAAWEQPQLLAGELRSFLATVERS